MCDDLGKCTTIVPSRKIGEDVRCILSCLEGEYRETGHQCCCKAVLHDSCYCNTRSPIFVVIFLGVA